MSNTKTLCKTPIFITAYLVDLIACFMFIIVGVEISKGMRKVEDSIVFSDEKDTHDHRSSATKALCKLWLVIGTVLFVCLY